MSNYRLIGWVTMSHDTVLPPFPVNPTMCFMLSGIAAIGLINEALDEGDPMKTLAMLQNPSAKLTDVDVSVAQHYHDKLLEARREKAHVRQRTPEGFPPPAAAGLFTTGGV